MFENRNLIVVSLSLALCILSIPWFVVACEYFIVAKAPNPSPISLPATEPVSSTITFSIPFIRGNQTYSAGPYPTDFATLTLSGNDTISAGVPLNVSIIMKIAPIAGYGETLDNPFSLVIDNSIGGFPASVDPGVSIGFLRNSTNNAYSIYGGSAVMNLTTSGLLSEYFVLPIYAHSNSSLSSPMFLTYLKISNTTSIDLQSYEDLQLEKQNLIIENENLNGTAQNERTNNLIIGLTLVIVGVAFVDVGVSIFEYSERKEKRNSISQGEIHTYRFDQEKGFWYES